VFGLCCIAQAKWAKFLSLEAMFDKTEIYQIKKNIFKSLKLVWQTTLRI